MNFICHCERIFPEGHRDGVRLPSRKDIGTMWRARPGKQSPLFMQNSARFLSEIASVEERRLAMTPVSGSTDNGYITICCS